MTNVTTTAPWTDMTLRPEGEPEIDVNPMTGEYEFTWTLAAEGGRITLLMPKDAVDRLTIRARELLALLSLAIVALS